MPEPGPKYAFSHEDLSVYERIDPEEFDNFDDVDSTVFSEVVGQTWQSDAGQWRV